MKQTKHADLRQALIAASKAPEGFAKVEFTAHCHSLVAKVVCSMANKTPKRLHTAFVHRNHVRYFDTAIRAAEYRDKHTTARRSYPGEPTIRKRSVRAPDGPAVTPNHVKVQICPGYERVEQRRHDFIGAFASAGVGRYPFPGTWSDNVLGGAS